MNNRVEKEDKKLKLEKKKTTPVKKQKSENKENIEEATNP
jgi:hypothetical protein